VVLTTIQTIAAWMAGAVKATTTSTIAATTTTVAIAIVGPTAEEAHMPIIFRLAAFRAEA
jgi:hypothetical protein